MQPCRVGPRSEADLALLAQVLREVHLRDGYPARWPSDPCAWLTPADLVGAWTAHGPVGPVGHVALTGVRGGEPTSDAWGATAQCGPTGLLCLTRLFVARHVRGTGTGAALLAHAEVAAASSGRRAVLEVAESDASAVRLYQRRGWLDAGSVTRAWLPAGTRSRLFVAPPSAGR